MFDSIPEGIRGKSKSIGFYHFNCVSAASSKTEKSHIVLLKIYINGVRFDWSCMKRAIFVFTHHHNNKKDRSQESNVLRKERDMKLWRRYLASYFYYAFVLCYCCFRRAACQKLSLDQSIPKMWVYTNLGWSEVETILCLNLCVILYVLHWFHLKNQ